MLSRTSKETVTFKNSFIVGNFKETQQAGDYAVETDEEMILGLSFPVYRRISTRFHLHQNSRQPGIKHILTINPKDLDAALARDQISTDLAIDAVLAETPEPASGFIGQHPGCNAHAA